MCVPRLCGHLKKRDSRLTISPLEPKFPIHICVIHRSVLLYICMYVIHGTWGENNFLPTINLSVVLSTPHGFRGLLAFHKCNHVHTYVRMYILMDCTQGPTDCTQGPTDCTQGPTDCTQGPTDCTQGSTDCTQGPTDCTQSIGTYY